ncbi:MAG TPA: hypothetical protein PK746_06880 [Spirochaetales bacterium]|nr:hypothetical protein [Spirochaetales bacterium]
MKRIALVIAIISILLVSVGAQDLKEFQEQFEIFAGAMAPVLSYNATTGDIWSTAYLGNLPHFGAGLTFGISMIPSTTLNPFFEAMGAPIPQELQNGLPFPAIALTAKLGGLILPFDIGVKGMKMFPELAALLAGKGISADYTLLGATIRVPVINAGLKVSIGASYDYLSGNITMPLDGMPTASYTFTDGAATHTIAVTNPKMALDFTTSSFDFTAQASIKVLFITPYAGAGISLGTSSVLDGLDAELTYDGQPISESNLQTIKDTLAQGGITLPVISAEGFRFGSEHTEPVIRLYGGVSLNLLFIYVDAMAIYIPANGNVGANVLARIQF